MTEGADKLLGIVKDLAGELHPGRDASQLNLDSTLDRDLGLDSLARVELLARIERAFGVGLPERILTAAETPRDILREISGAEGRSRLYGGVPGENVSVGRSHGVPLHAATLVDVLEWHAATHPARPHIRLFADEGEGEVITYGRLRQEAGRIAAGLVRRGLVAGESVVLMLPTGPEYFFAFLGVLLAGGVPVPVYPPGHVRQIREHLLRHVSIVANSRARIMITVPEALRFSRLALSRLPEMRHVTTHVELSSGEHPGAEAFQGHPQGPGDTAFLQYTSGSTGTPKGVVLSHANLLANIRAMGTAISVTPSDVFVSWLPLYHDMGLIGAWLGSLHYGCHLVIMSPLAFIARPERWLWAIHRYGGTLSAAPNFAYELCVRRIADEEISGLNLGSWRCAFNGAEAVSPRTIRNFIQRFETYGFRPETMMPVFGLAENSVGLTFPPLGRRPVMDRVERDPLMKRGVAIPAAEQGDGTLEFVDCGHPLPGHRVRIVDAGGRELPDRHEGRLQFQGPSATRGYYRNAGQTRELFEGAWLNTGDLAYIADGSLFVTGRTKDIVIRAGQNIYPVELEEAVGALDGVRSGAVAVFGSMDAGSGTERLVVLAETRKRDPVDREDLRGRIVSVVTELSGMPPDDVVLAPPNTVLKTSSGKIRRAASRDLYERGMVGKPRRAVWLQVTGFYLRGIPSRARRILQSGLAYLYAGYCWFTFGLTGAVAWVVILGIRDEAVRWRFVRRAVGILTRIVGMPVAVEGAEDPLPADFPCIFVSNHASYLDGFVIAGAMPRPVRFVVKGELRGNFFARSLLEQLGAEFVERFDRERGTRDLERLTAAARTGNPLFFFPEGTFARMPGLLPFRMGAFETAARANLPIVPLALRGTRSVLRGGSWFPRRGFPRVIIGPPIHPDGDADQSVDSWGRAVVLRDRVRAWILEHCGEPDLGHENAPIFSPPPGERP